MKKLAKASLVMGLVTVLAVPTLINAEIGEMKQVMPGKSVRLDQIPMLSGDYTIQGSAEIEGVYTFKIN